MLTLQFYRAEESDDHLGDCLLASLAEALGLTGADSGYRHATWSDPATGATAEVDLGLSPLEADHLHPDRGYEGWIRLPVQIQLHAGGPHWHCVELGHWLGDLLIDYPEVGVLNTEDVADPEGLEGPGLFDRHRLLASWEALHGAFVAGREQARCLGRRQSMILWRYRREAAQGMHHHGDLHWPRIVVLEREGDLRLAVLAPKPFRDLALPPVDLLVVDRGDDTPGLLPVDEVLTVAGTAERVSEGAVQALRQTPDLDRLLAVSRLMPIVDWRLLGDGDWDDVPLT